jgi:serine/threonine protein kinase
MATPAQDQVRNTPSAGLRTAGGRGGSSNRDDALVDRLAAELAAAWRQGERLLVEDFLARHPEVNATPDLTARLVYEEYCLRQELDPDAATMEVLGRFPHLDAELKLILECHRLMERTAPAPIFPEVGEMMGGFHLVAELGRGARGRVFLATQPALADRPIVLKLSPMGDLEHLSLARLQHTHVVPLYAQEDFPTRNLRALCMPYLGGTTLAGLLQALAEVPPRARTGQQVLDVLGRIETPVPVALPRPGATAAFRTSYARAVCWIGACLADALHYAHERGLVHLDVKPSNVLLAADGQPMLLDFHLAQEPIPAGEPAPGWLGGTSGYMSPEQEDALAAVQTGEVVARAVDGRSDIYSLGVLLYETLAGQLPQGKAPRRLEKVNAQVSVGLADIVHRCLEREPGRRYPDAARLAVDLRRHLDDLPLRGVSNRSLGERWRKWRRRQPYGLLLHTLLIAFFSGLLTVGSVYLSWREKRYGEVDQYFRDAQAQMHQQRYGEAVGMLKRGIERARDLPGARALKKGLDDHLRLAERAADVQHLHLQAEIVRYLFEFNFRDLRMPLILEAGCRQAWEARHLLRPTPEMVLTRGEENVRFDLLDIAVFRADFHVRAAEARGEDLARARREALDLLDEAERVCGPSPVIDHDRRLLHQALGLPEPAREAADRSARSAEEHCSLARRLLLSGDTAAARAEVEAARRLQPEGFWPNYCYGVWAYRAGKYAEAQEAFCLCVGRFPSAECLWKRGQAYAAAGRTQEALQDLDRVLLLKPEHGEARELMARLAGERK